MSDEKSGVNAEVNRRKILKSAGAVGGGVATLGTMTQKGGATPTKRYYENVPDVETMREAFATHGQQLLEELSDRGIIEQPTPRALNIRETSSTRGNEGVGYTATFRRDGKTYRAIDTIISSGTTRAVVS